MTAAPAQATMATAAGPGGPQAIRAIRAIRVTAFRRWPGVRGGALRERAGRESAAEYRAAGGYAPILSPAAGLLEEIAAAGLRGRGGAAFPAARKVRAVMQAPGPRVAVANGEEGEPASAKDRYLLRTRPHLVLDGLRYATRACGARRAVVYLSDVAAEQAVRTALAEEPDVWDVPVTVHRVARSYVAGEESALVRALDGGPALPTAKPPRPYEAGVGGRPTLILNVETLARLALILGAAGAGAPAAAHTFLATVVGPVTPVATAGPAASATVFEVPYGTAFGDLVRAHGCDPSSLRGALAGGLFGGVLRGPWHLPLDPGAFAAAGSALGCGAFVLLGADNCAVDAAADAVTYLAAESARQCGVCINATAGMRDVLAKLRGGTAEPAAIETIARWAQRVRGRGACGLVDATAQTVASLLREFDGEVRDHLAGPCPRCAALGPLPRHTRFAVD